VANDSPEIPKPRLGYLQQSISTFMCAHYYPTGAMLVMDLMKTPEKATYDSTLKGLRLLRWTASEATLQSFLVIWRKAA
jgi:hypothetical protein